MPRKRSDFEQGGVFRRVLPGEVEHEIDRSQLHVTPAPVWDRVTTEACESIYRNYVELKAGHLIPEAAFCDLERSTFLDYLVQHREILLMGSKEPELSQLEPLVLSRNLIGWDKPRYLAFSSSTEAIYRAILDTARLEQLDRSLTTTVALPFGEEKGFYFGLDSRVVSEAPWSDGTVYLYRRADFPEDFQSRPFLTDEPIRPIAKLRVRPQDWPLLGCVAGIDHAAQIQRQWDTFLGYPWCDDQAIHPGIWKRPLAEGFRNYLEAHYAEPAGLVRLGKTIGSSAFATLRIFRSVMGQSPHEYQTWFRISTAKDFLRHGLPIAEVAAETGFCDQTHLTRHFKRLVGLTPGAYLRAQESPIH